MLQALGVAETEERVYRELLRDPRASVSEIAQAAGLGRSVLAQSLKWLEVEGLVSRIPGRPTRYVPTPPDVACEVLARQRLGEIERVRGATRELLDEYHAGAERVPEDVVQSVRGSEAVVQRFEQLQRSARRQVRILDCPPYARGNIANTTELELLAEGLEYRVIYDARSFEVPGSPEFLPQYAAAGEQARTLPRLPTKLVLCDDTLALVPLGSETGIGDRLLIRPSPLLVALSELFEILWARAIPLWQVSSEQPGPASEDDTPVLRSADQQILALLAAGLQDAAVARQLGMGLRTVRRRIGLLMEQLDAQTRYQAGIQAARRGWS